MPSLTSRVVFILMLCSMAACELSEGADTAPELQRATAGGLQVDIGLAGAWKLGHACPVRVQFSPPLQASIERVEIATVDGDGVPVTYTKDVEAGTAAVNLTIRIGRMRTPLIVRALGSQGVLEQLRLQPDELGRGLSSDQPMVVALGGAMGIEQLSRSSADRTSASFATAVLSRAEQLPTDWRDYAFADLLIISCNDVEFLSQVEPAQWMAVDAWIRRGGGCIISLHGQATPLPEPVQALLPGTIVGQSTISNPGGVESLVGSLEDPLQAFPASRIELDRGEVELSLADSFGRDLPWLVEYAHGHGTVQLVASPLDAPAFEQWKDRKRLWQLFVGSYIDANAVDGKGMNRASDSSYLGYADLVGQLRATLDVFPSVRVVSFGQIAVVLVGILILIGPLDYFVSVKWLKRPHVSWIFAGTTLLLVSGGLTWFYHAIRPDELHINSAQIVDIDAATGKLNGHIWSHVYSGTARRVSLKVDAQSDAAVHVDWQGLPGRGLGGLLSELNADRGMPTYEIELNADGGSTIVDVGIPAAGTKCIVGSWVSSVELGAAPRLVEIPGVQQLSGELVNPLNVDLNEPSLLYRNWYYSLNSRIAPGERVSISYDTIPKDAARRLNRRHTVEGSNVITPWDPADRGSLDRLLELMMFHRAASGRAYTSLEHRYQPHIDQSNLMNTDQAILIGRVDQPWASVQLSFDDQDESPVPVIRDTDRVWCRIIIPVTQAVQK